MSKIAMQDWKCPECGYNTVTGHHQEWAGGHDSRGEHWVTKDQRDASPELASKCGHGGPAVWVEDSAWKTCDKCGYRLTPEETKHVCDVETGIWGKIMRSEKFFREEIGAVIINDYAIRKTSIAEDVNEPCT